jgi:hypothetical protein
MSSRNTRQKLFNDTAPVLSTPKRDEEEPAEEADNIPDEMSEDQDSQGESADALTPTPKRPQKRRRGKQVSKKTKDKWASTRRTENLRAIESLDISVGDEIILHSRDPGDDEAKRFGDYEFSCIKYPFSNLHYKLFGCTPIGVWTVDAIQDGTYTLKQKHTTSRNPAIRICSERWPAVLEAGYSQEQKAWIGAYELLHRLVDKTVTHVRTKITPSRKPTLQWLCLQVLAQNERAVPQIRKRLPSHLLEEFDLCRKGVIPIPIEFRIANLAYDSRKQTLVKALPGVPNRTGKVWRILPEAASYELIWHECARILLPTNPTVPDCFTGLSLEPQQGAAAFMDEYLAACRRGDAKFALLFDYVWEIRRQPRYSGGCLAGDNAVLVAPAAGHGAVAKLVRDVRAGDVVACEGGYAPVVAAWRIPAGEARPMVRLRGVWLTPDHPVLDPAAGRWCRADALAPAEVLRDVDGVYNLAVETRRGVLVAAGPAEGAAAGAGGGAAPAEEAVVCCTLGQGVPGMADAVWGTEVILAWMRTHPAWPNLVAPAPHLPAPAAAAHGLGGGGGRWPTASGAAPAGVAAQG